jgi:tetratricopeptide (TPR) repeat protein
MKHKPYCTTLLILTLCWSGIFPLFAQQPATRAQSVRITGDDGKPLDLYDESHALVIGISDYNKGWRKLPGVKKDVTEVSRVLRAQSFTSVTERLDLTREQFDTELRTFISRYGLRDRNRLVIYFAGHGHTERVGGDDRELGYIVMRDAPLPDRDPSGFYLASVSMDEINSSALRIKAKHALFVFDSCFSGTIFRSEADRRPPPAIASLTAAPVRQFITSGASGQEVPDNSIFRAYFVRAFEQREGDLNNDGFITGEELGKYLMGTVAGDSRHAQTPRYGKIQDSKLNLGDVVFALKQRENVVTTPNLLSGEQAWYVEIQNSNDITELEAFVKAYPNGQYAGAIQSRLRRLRASAATPMPPSHPTVADLLSRAYEALRRNNDEQAISLANEILRAEPKNGVAHRLLGSAYSTKNDNERVKSEEEAVRRIITKPTKAEEYDARAWVYNGKDNDRSIADYNKALELNPQFVNAYGGRGAAYYNKQEYDRAIADYGKALELDPQYVRAYLNRGIAYLNKGENDQAIRDLTEAIRLKPEEAETYLDRGLAYREKQNYDDAIKDFTKAIELAPKSADHYFNRGRVYLAKGENDRAIRDLTEAIRLDPEHHAYHYRGKAYRYKSENDLAIQDLTEAIRLKPEEAETYLDRGLAYREKQNYDDAIKDFTKAIELDGKSASGYTWRGEVYHSKKEYDRAIADCTKAIELDPKDSDSYLIRGLAYTVKGNYDDAMKDLTKAIELDTKIALAYRIRGLLYAGKNNYDQAIPDYNKAVEIDPKNAENFRNRAEAWRAKGRNDLAEADEKMANQLEGKK